MAERQIVRRPAGRRAQIVAAACRQFHRSGYHGVSMADVAAEVGITAPALYRHFAGKPELLRCAVESELAALHAAARPQPGGTAGLCARLAVAAVDHRALGALWRRDARLLPPAERARLRRGLRADVRSMTAVLADERPELQPHEAEFLCWSALSAYGSLANHTFAPPRRRFEQLLRRIGGELLAAAPAAGGAAPVPGPRPAPPVADSRREELLTAAVRLFNERGFENVSTDRIGAAVGIAGPSVYKHFATKSELLAAALVRSRERLRYEVEGAFAAAPGGGPAAALDAGLRGYVDFARRNSDYLGAMLSETERLDPADRRAAVEFRRWFLRRWVDLLQQVRADYDTAEARIRVHAMFALVNDGVRHPAGAPAADRAALLEAAGRAVLGLLDHG
ncbi:TetR/AcrR family transcriptional regulator [Kitasatospora sp. NPDC059571]|uniref:TetR/AcrR family transcriptional regulator n=1 Tax=Kitasatospora sp. NPDC059571 TaxID=3346871 RepID=UPI003694C881